MIKLGVGDITQLTLMLAPKGLYLLALPTKFRTMTANHSGLNFNSIKKVLPSILNISEFIKKKYSNPIYGSASGIKSKNFNNFQWLQIDEAGCCKDPYAILAELSAPIELTDQSFVIADGGAATTAYARLQFEDLKESDRMHLEKSLLHYCELDTFAMVLIVEFWRNELGI